MAELQGVLAGSPGVEAGLIYVNEDGRRWEFLKGRVAFPDLDRNGHKDLNEMATEAGWDAARKRLYALLEKAGSEYEYGGK